MSEPTIEIHLEPDFENLFTEKPTDCIIEIRLNAPRRIENGQRAPINVGLVIDRSGSMSGLKLDYAKRAALFALDLLAEKDKAGLIAYDHGVATISPCVPLDRDNKQRLKNAITEISVGGNTNLSGGWLRGCQLLGEILDPAAVQRCLLLTDGLANHGITNVGELAFHAGEIFKRGVSTSTFGVGDEYDERLLEAMANHGGGRYYYIANAQDIPLLFQQEFEGLTCLTARHTRLQVTLPAGASARVVGDWRYQTRGQELEIEVNELTSEQEVFIYLQVSFAGDGEGTGADVHVVVSADGENSRALQAEASLTFQHAPDSVIQSQPVNRSMLMRFKKVEAAIELEKALRMEKEGRRQEGSHLILDYLKAAAPSMDKDEYNEYQRKAQIISRGMTESDRKLEHMRSYNNRQSRREQMDEILRRTKPEPDSEPPKTD